MAVNLQQKHIQIVTCGVLWKTLAAVAPSAAAHNWVRVLGDDRITTVEKSQARGASMPHHPKQSGWFVDYWVGQLVMEVSEICKLAAACETANNKK